MHDSARDLEASGTRAHQVDGAPWATALNETAASDNILVTLHALAVVVPGPWVFRFSVPDGRAIGGEPDRRSSIGEA